jgi:hypothetical protein
MPATPDVGAFDAPTQVADARLCLIDEDCDNGLFCDGDEICRTGVCTPGVRACDDGVACTDDFCSEDRRRCANTPPDLDGDGYPSASCIDARGMALGNDCDDSDAARHPGNLEVCDGDDEDCDPTTLGEVDADRDGHIATACCNPTSAGAMCGDDCDDARSAVNPTGVEVCDGIDQDCDTRFDEGVQALGYIDADFDGYGVGMAPATERYCAGTLGFAAASGDCDDANPARNPGQLEICDMVDNDCDAMVDDGTREVDWFLDRDGDGYGSRASGVVRSCNPVPGATLLDNDCNDADPLVDPVAASIHPGAAELCNGLDDNCNGLADFRIGPGDFEDDDADGVIDVACAPFGRDCNDNDAGVGPGSAEECNMTDDDCDGLVDEGSLSYIYYADNDRDGFGSAVTGTVVACRMPMGGYVVRGGDCNDSDAARYPGATETCDGSDQDCDAATDESPAALTCNVSTPAGQAPNTLATACSAGACVTRTCAIGRADCNGAFADGCETNTDADVSNCGRCGVTCTGGVACLGGICSTSYLSPGTQLTVGTRPTNATYQIDTTRASTIYYTTDGSTPGASATTLSGPAPVSGILLTNGQTVRWYADYGSGVTDPIRSYRHMTDAPSSINVGQLATNVSFSGQGAAARVARSTSVNLTMTLQEWKDSPGACCPGCITQGIVYLDGFGQLDCLGARAGYPGTTRTVNTTFTAPATPGRYFLRLGATWEFGCRADLMALHRNEVVGVLEVF